MNAFNECSKLATNCEMNALLQGMTHRKRESEKP